MASLSSARQGNASVSLILGGARSGKSRFAEGLLDHHEGKRIFLATAEPGDTEMRARIEDHRRRQLAAGQHEIAYGNLIRREMLCHPLVDTFVAPADQNDSLELRESSRRFLTKQLPCRGEQHDRRSGGSRWNIFAYERIHSFENRLGLHHHALAASKRPVIDGAMAVVREVAQIVNVCFDEPRFARTPDDAVIERPREEFRENCDDVKAHDFGDVKRIAESIEELACNVPRKPHPSSASNSALPGSRRFGSCLTRESELSGASSEGRH